MTSTGTLTRHLRAEGWSTARIERTIGNGAAVGALENWLSNDLVIGVLGNGEIAKNTVVALLADRVSDTLPHFLIPMTEEHWSPVVAAITAWVIKHKHPYEVIVDGTDPEGFEELAAVKAGALITHKVTAVETKMVTLLASEAGGILILAWDDADDACQRALDKAIKRGVPAYNLLDSLNVLRYDDDPEPPREREFEDREAAQAAAKTDREPAAVLEEPEAPAEPPKRTRRTKAQMEAARAAEAAPEPAVVSAGQIELVMVSDEAQQDIVVETDGSLKGFQITAASGGVLDIPTSTNGNGLSPVGVSTVVELFLDLIKTAVADGVAAGLAKAGG